MWEKGAKSILIPATDYMNKIIADVGSLTLVKEIAYVKLR